MPRISINPPIPVITTDAARSTTETASTHSTIYLTKKKMKSAKQVTTILLFVLVVGVVVTMFPRLFEMFQVGDRTTTCPECRNDGHCDQCGLTGYRCDKKFKDGKEFGTCTKGGM